MREKTVKDLEIGKIAIFRALQLGDLLTIIPSVRALRKTFPKTEITLIGLPWARDFVSRFNKYFDRFIEFPGFPGLPERAFNPQAFVQFLSQIQDENFDLAIQMQGSGYITNPMMELLNARNMAGFYGEGHYRPNKDFFIPYVESGHEAEKFLKLMEGIGIKSDGTHLEFPVLEAEAEAATRLLAEHHLQERAFVCIHTGSREEARRWNAENFAKTADYIYSRGYKVAFTGTQKERESIHKIAKMSQSPSVNLAGRTHLGELAAILKKCALLVTNDTGVVHIAIGVGAKSVIIYNKEGSNIERWAPINRKRHSVIEPERAKQLSNVLKELDLRLRAQPKREYEHARAI
ncbi:MAG TPA: glycosyltransferase family 9 protein [Balneolaceae bacterium]|nr:glycosyltransferase family 9 protein [Balneolaceae bacterium]